MLFDLFVHHRVGEHRLVAFVVTKAAVADNIQNDVLVELLTEFGGHTGSMHNCFWVVAVDVENRCLDHQRDVGGVGAGAAKVRRCRKADLVVHDDMHRAAGFVTFQAGQAEAFCNDTLARECRIAMQQNAHDAFAINVAFLILLGADFADDHRVHGL